MRLARLLTSINVAYSDRPLRPIEVCDEIWNMLYDLDGDKDELVKRLPLKTDMINAFLRLRRLPAQIQDLVVWGDSKKESGEISFSVAHQLVKLKEEDDILKLASAIHHQDKRPITKEELKSIISAKKHNQDKSIDECIKQVTNITRPIIIEHFLFISGISPEIVNKLKNNSKTGRSIEKLALDIISKKFPSDSLHNIKIFDDYIQLAMTKEGRAYIQEYSKLNNLLRKDVITHILNSGGF